MVNPGDTGADLVIVSVFGRGHWMAAELAGHGVSVALVELSNQMGRWSPEDVEGPFGYFHASNLTLSQKARLDEEDYSEQLDDGFVLWLKNGPIDMRSMHSVYALKKAGITNDVLEYVGNYDGLAPKRRDELVKGWRHQPFSANWFVNLAHSLASPFSNRNHEALQFGRPLPLTAPYAIRRVSRRGFEKSLQWVEALGVNTRSKAVLKTLDLHGHYLHGFIFEDGRRLNGEQFVWCLTSGETKRLASPIFNELFPHGELTPEWVWIRYRIGLSKSHVTDSLPLKVLVLEDLGLPWSHANLIWLQRTTSSEIFDGWVRIPAVHRFQKPYLEAMGREIVGTLEERLPGVNVNVAEPPQEFTYEPNELGPALFQSFEPSVLNKFNRCALRNLQFDGPEVWGALDWSARMESQKALVENIVRWKKERELLDAKMAAKTNRIHPGGGSL